MSKPAKGGKGGVEVVHSPEDSGFTTAVRFVICVGGIYACYLYYGILQEKITTTNYGGERFSFSLYLIFVQCILNTILGVVMYFIMRPGTDRTPWSSYAMMGFSYIAAMFLSNYSLNFVDYPTQVLAKSCKPIPVLLVGVIFHGKRYGFLKYISVLLVTGGISMFLLAKSSSKGGHGSGVAENNVIGYVLLLGSLICDGLTANYQEKVMHTYAPSPQHLMIFSNIFAVLYMAIFPVISVVEPSFSYVKQFVEPTAFIARHPDAGWDVLMFAVTSALGQNFIFMTVAYFGALLLSMVTTTRKFFTILASVLYFGHPLLFNQWAGVGLVFAGLVVDTVESQLRKKAEKAEKDAAKQSKGH